MRAVDLHQSALVELDAGLGEPEPLDVRAAPGGDDEIVDLCARLLPRRRRRRASRRRSSRLPSPGLHVGDRRAGVHVDALPLETALDQTRDVGVLGRAARGRAPRAAAPRCPGGRSPRRSPRPRRPRRRPPGGRAAPAAPRPARSRSRARRTRRRGSDARPSRSRGSRSAAEIVSPVDAHTFPSAVSDASPSIRSIPFFLNSPATPEVSVETTFSRRACTAG